MILSDTDRPCHHHQRDIYNTTQDKYKIGQPFYGMARFARLIYLRLLLSLAGRWSTGLVAGAGGEISTKFYIFHKTVPIWARVGFSRGFDIMLLVGFN